MPTEANALVKPVTTPKPMAEQSYTPGKITFIQKNIIPDSPTSSSSTPTCVSSSPQKPCACFCHSKTSNASPPISLLTTTTATVTTPITITTPTSTVASPIRTTKKPYTTTPVLWTSATSPSTTTRPTTTTRLSTSSYLRTTTNPTTTTIQSTTPTSNKSTTTNTHPSTRTTTITSRPTTPMSSTTTKLITKSTLKTAATITSGTVITKPAGTTTTYMPNHTEVNIVFTNSIPTISKTNVTEQETTAITSRPKPKTQKNIKKSLIFTKYCDRPKTSELTTEKNKMINNTTEPTSVLVFTSSNTSATKKMNIPSTTETTVKLPLICTLGSTTTLKQSTAMTMDNKTQPTFPHTIKTTASTILQTESTTKKTTACINCQRPTTWETTTEKVLPYIFITTPTQNIVTKTIPQKTSAAIKTKEGPHEIATLSYKIASVEDSPEITRIDLGQIILKRTTFNKKTTPQTETDEYLENTVINEKEVFREPPSDPENTSKGTDEDIISISDENPDKVRLKKEVFTQASDTVPTTISTTIPTTTPTTWWYPTTCDGNCERPVTWQTTRRRQAWHRNYY